MKFTVGLPITKTGHLMATLEGIKNQSFQDFEVIIKNNANSPEKKAEIKEMCKEWITKPNVKYFESESQLSMTQNFNSILEKAEGEYFLIISDDDVMEPDYLMEFKRLSEKHLDVNIFHCRVKRIDDLGNLIDFSELCPEFESQIDFVYHRLIDIRSLELSDYVLKTQAFKNEGGFTNLPKGWGTDEINWIKMARDGVVFTPEILLCYRRFLGNFSLSKENLQGRFQDIEIMHKVIDDTIEKNCSDGKCIYPKEYLLKLSLDRKQRQMNNVLISMGKSSNNLQIIQFYLKNRGKIKSEAFIRAILIKVGKSMKK